MCIFVLECQIWQVVNTYVLMLPTDCVANFVFISVDVCSIENIDGTTDFILKKDIQLPVAHGCDIISVL